MIDKIGAGIYETLEEFPVVILCLDAPGNRPVVGYVLLPDGASVAHSWSAEGKCSLGLRRVTEMDLRPVKRKPREVWLYQRNINRIEDGKWSHAHPKKNSDDMVLFREVMEDE